MKNNLLKKLTTGLAVLGLVLLPAVSVEAFSPFQGVCNGDGAKSTVCQDRGSGKGKGFSIARSILNTLFVVAGIIAVIMVIVGGIRFVVSAGDQGQVKNARDTVLYAVIGLVIAMLSFAIVNFVLDRI